MCTFTYLSIELHFHWFLFCTVTTSPLPAAPSSREYVDRIASVDRKYLGPNKLNKNAIKRRDTVRHTYSNAVSGHASYLLTSLDMLICMQILCTASKINCECRSDRQVSVLLHLWHLPRELNCSVYYKGVIDGELHNVAGEK